MVKRSFEDIIDKAKKVKGIFLVGAGVSGKELLGFIQQESTVDIIGFFDNNKLLQGKFYNGVEITSPYNKGNEYLYIITVDNGKLRKELYKQLENIGVNSECILTYFRTKDYEYKSTLDKKFYEEEISEQYEAVFGKKMNWNNPTTYTEIINWEKLNLRDKRRTRLADKYLVREWVKEKIGEEHLTTLYGVWDNVEEINFDNLPNSFVLKPNHRSGRNIIVKDKSKINIDEVCKKLKVELSINHAYISYELHYRDIKPKIICEEYLEGVAESLYDYNIYCFHGEPEYIWCIKGSHRPGCQASFYNKNWEIQPFSLGYPKDPILAPRPERLEEMLELSRKLSGDFEHVRVDWYSLPDGRLLFGEMTFSTWAGIEKFEPEEYDLIFGNMIKNK